MVLFDSVKPGPRGEIEHSPALRGMRLAEYMLIAFAAPAFFESAWEMYFLTWQGGKQNLFYYVAHAAPGWALLFLLVSWLGFIVLLIFNLVVVLVLQGFAKSRVKEPVVSKLFRYVLLVQIAHLLFLFTYSLWA